MDIQLYGNKKVRVMEEKEVTYKTYIKKHISIIIMLVLFLAAIIIIKLPQKENDISNEIEYSSVDRICELATLRCYYHNVAEDEIQPDGLFKYGLFKFGYKKMWLEYDGVIDVGIEFSEVDISPPVDNVVTIYVPEAKILDPDADIKSVGELISDKGKFTAITAEDQANMFAMAQESMKESAAKDSNILYQAHENAKKLLKEYVISLGKEMGLDLTVKWSDVPLD